MTSEVSARAIKNRHSGQPCVILANGESLCNFAAESVPADAFVIGLNRSWELIGAPYHCIIDLKQLEAARDNGIYFDHLLIGQGDNEQREAAKLGVLKEVRAEAVTLLRGQESRYGLGFCADLERDRFFIPSVPYMALQIAAWMGTSEIHIWGLDLHGSKFWDKDWQIMHATAQLQNRQCKLANRALKAMGVRVVNHSRGTHCTAFEVAQ